MIVVRSPRVRDAQDLCEQLCARGVIILAFSGGRISGASYGETKAECASVAKTLDAIVEELQDGALPGPVTR